ncbi:MAG: hypothetical protein AAB410_00515 [Patescibacteria group bacterium]
MNNQQKLLGVYPGNCGLLGDGPVPDNPKNQKASKKAWRPREVECPECGRIVNVENLALVCDGFKRPTILCITGCVPNANPSSLEQILSFLGFPAQNEETVPAFPAPAQI